MCVCVCAASSSRSHHASSFDSGSMECYTILGSEGRTEPTGKRQGRIGEEDEGEREKERERTTERREGSEMEPTKERADERERDGGSDEQNKVGGEGGNGSGSIGGEDEGLRTCTFGTIGAHG